MKSLNLHPWNPDYKEAVAIQEKLAAKISLKGAPRRVRTIAGADVSYERKAERLFAAVIVMDAHTLEVIETGYAIVESTFPYIPGLLSFREAPSVIEAASELKTAPDVIIADAQGIAHPRELGLASHLGLLLGCPSIGCAKSRLIGEHEDVGRDCGESVPLRHQGRRIGTVLRTRTDVRPLYVSPGYKIGFERAAKIVLQTCRGYRLPEPTRQAHLFVNKMRRENG
jgi:deoxyribonuclease V